MVGNVHLTKAKAQKIAVILRRNGMTAKIRKVKGGYVIDKSYPKQSRKKQEIKLMINKTIRIKEVM